MADEQSTKAQEELTLGQRQRLFTRLLAKLVERIYEAGDEATMGEVWRPPEMAAWYAQQGKGIKNSLHCDRLAADVNLFRGGVWLKDPVAFEPYGVWWEQQHPLCAWGGRFGDANHFSVMHGGRK